MWPDDNSLMCYELSDTYSTAHYLPFILNIHVDDDKIKYSYNSLISVKNYF